MPKISLQKTYIIACEGLAEKKLFTQINKWIPEIYTPDETKYLDIDNITDLKGGSMLAQLNKIKKNYKNSKHTDREFNSIVWITDKDLFDILSFNQWKKDNPELAKMFDIVIVFIPAIEGLYLEIFNIKYSAKTKTDDLKILCRQEINKLYHTNYEKTPKEEIFKPKLLHFYKSDKKTRNAKNLKQIVEIFK